GGPDAAFSMEPLEFKQMVEACHEAYSALGQVNYELTEKNKNRRRSLFVSQNINKGDVLTTENVRSVRPGIGLHPKYFQEIIGRKASIELQKGTPLSFKYID